MRDEPMDEEVTNEPERRRFLQAVLGGGLVAGVTGPALAQGTPPARGGSQLPGLPSPEAARAGPPGPTCPANPVSRRESSYLYRPVPGLKLPCRMAANKSFPGQSAS